MPTLFAAWRNSSTGKLLCCQKERSKDLFLWGLALKKKKQARGKGKREHLLPKTKVALLKNWELRDEATKSIIKNP